MSLVLVTPPSQIGVSEFHAVEHLRLGEWIPSEMALVETYIETATSRLDGRDGLLGRALLTQTWKLVLPCFPSQFKLPLPPCQSVDSITYYDTDGNEQTLPTSDYQVFGIHPTTVNVPAQWQAAYGTRYETGPATITPVDSWPDTDTDHLEAMQVTFTAGYSDEFSGLPKQLQQAILMDVGHLYENRESFIVGQSFSEVPLGYMDLIAPFREWSF